MTLRKVVCVGMTLILCSCGKDTTGGNNNTNGNQPASCGNGIVEGTEHCDNGENNSDTEPNACRSNCVPAACGDGVADTGEGCDGDDLGGQICEDLGFDGGSLACTLNCTLYMSGCTICGDEDIEGEEECDSTNLGGATCGSETNLQQGNLSCTNECTFNTTDCHECGNGSVEGPEGCDDGNTDGCDACSPTCQLEVCGNGTLDCGEQCDDGNTVPGDGCGATCQLENCGNGQVDPFEECDEGTANSDTTPNACRTNCRNPWCGDGVTDAGEQCDQAAANSDTTPNACRTNCALPACNDGVLDDSTEDCDGTDLGQATCASAGTYTDGTLACFGNCTFNTTGCYNCGDGLCGPNENGNLCPQDCFESPTQCGDGVDNDNDGATDCADPDCNSHSCGPHGLICANNACACPYSGHENTASECQDTTDNDCDGLHNCADPNCNSVTCGLNGRQCNIATQTCECPLGGVENTQTLCSDNLDNDCDGSIDCGDSSCNHVTCGVNGLWCNNGNCECSGNGGTPQGAESLCADGADNDCDGFTDCADQNCHQNPPTHCNRANWECIEVIVGMPWQCVCPVSSPSSSEYVLASSCWDGVDNDCDGKKDCDDIDCNNRRCSQFNPALTCEYHAWGGVCN